MVVLVTSDLHLSDNPRDHYRHEFIDQLIEVIREEKVTRLLVLGDLTEKKDRHNSWLTNSVVEYFHTLSTWCPIVILQGNHDALDVNVPFFNFLHYVAGGRGGHIQWIGNPTEMDVPELGRCLFLPHTTSYRDRWSFVLGLDVKDLPAKKYEYIFAHNTFKGTISESGVELDGIPLDIFPKSVPVISGDVHKPQQVGQVTYVGSPYLVDFGDDFEPRMLLLRKGQPPESIPCLGPQKRLVQIEYSPGSNFIVTGVVHEGDILKVRVPVTKDLYVHWNEIQRRIREWGESHGVEIHTIQPVLETSRRIRKDKNSRSSVDDTRESDRQLVERYASIHKYGSKVVRVGHSFVD